MAYNKSLFAITGVVTLVILGSLFCCSVPSSSEGKEVVGMMVLTSEADSSMYVMPVIQDLSTGECTVTIETVPDDGKEVELRSFVISPEIFEYGERLGYTQIQIMNYILTQSPESLDQSGIIVISGGGSIPAIEIQSTSNDASDQLIVKPIVSDNAMPYVIRSSAPQLMAAAFAYEPLSAFIVTGSSMNEMMTTVNTMSSGYENVVLFASAFA